jgi:adenylate kinase
MGLSEMTLSKEIVEGLGRIERCLNPGSSESKDAIAIATAPGPVVLVGAPGVGKGTQADTLARIWRIPKISTGEILRANVTNGTALGIQADEIMRRGGLVTDHVITEMVADRLAVSDAAAGFILDGFPRTAKQAQWLDSHLAAHRNFAPLTIINLHMEPHKIIERIIHRRICPCCETVYNTRLKPPRRNGRCDHDCSALVQRSDDSIEVFQERLDAFKRETGPLIEHYRSHRMFMMVDADRPALNITKYIVESIARRNQLIHRN